MISVKQNVGGETQTSNANGSSVEAGAGLYLAHGGGEGLRVLPERRHVGGTRQPPTIHCAFWAKRVVLIGVSCYSEGAEAGIGSSGLRRHAHLLRAGRRRSV